MQIETMYQSFKPLLFSIAYRMLGSVSDAEDLVHDSFLTLSQLNGTEEKEPIKNWKAYLCKMITNRCIDHLKSARKKRELYVGTWLPEPYVQGYIDESGQDPANTVLMEEAISIAFLVMLERLTPVERAVFILRQAFSYDYSEIAYIVGKSEIGCRQIFSRVKRKVQAEEPAGIQTLERSQLLVQRFMQASATGNLEELIQLLTEEVVLYSDGGGKVLAAIHPIKTPQRVIQFLMGAATKYGANAVMRMAIVNGQIGLIVTGEENHPTVVCFEQMGDRLHRIYLIRNPDKLKHIT